MKLETKKTMTEEIEITIPSFYKKDQYGTAQFMGLINEKNVLQVFENELRISVSDTDAGTDQVKKDIYEAFSTWQEIGEDEFFYHYNRALNSLSVTPELITKP